MQESNANQDLSIFSRPDGPARELVVARYREDISWVDRIPADFHATVYNKSRDDCPLVRPHTQGRLANRGREAHTMLWHIVAHYDRLADYTYFCQGDALFHAPDFLERLAVSYCDLFPLSRTYSSMYPSPEIHASDWVCQYGGFEYRLGDAVADHGSKGTSWINPATWDYVFACPPPSEIYFAYAAMLVVPRQNITGRPRAFWGWLFQEADRMQWEKDLWLDPPLTPWQMEAIWMYLFQPNVYPHRTDGGRSG